MNKQTLKDSAPLVLGVAGLALIGYGLSRGRNTVLPGNVTQHDIDEDPTMTRQAARVAADTIYGAIYGDGSLLSGQSGENEDAVIGVFAQMRNDADVAQLIDAYGIRGGAWSLHGEMDLPATLTAYLSRADIADINAFLAEQAIQIRF